MNKTLTIEYETFDDFGIKVLTVIDGDEVVNILRDDDAEELYNQLITVAH